MRYRPMRSVCARLAALWVLTAAVSPAGAEPPRVYAVTGATVVAEPGVTIEAGTVVIRDGLIEAVGSGVSVPPDAVEIDASGMWVYPGLIDAHTTLGVGDDGSERRETEPRSRTGASGTPAPPGANHPIPLVHPELRVMDHLVPFEGDRKYEVERYRNLGFTAALVVPESGVFRGRSVAILLLDDAPVSDLILREDVAQHVGFDRSGFGGGYPTSLMGSVATIRQTLYDGRRHLVWTERYTADPSGMRRPDTLPAYAALAPVLGGRQVVVFELDDPADLEIAEALRAEFDLEAVISATGEEWTLAERVAATGFTLILPVARPDEPKVDDEDEALDVSLREMRRWLEAPSAPARLNEAGVEFALTTSGLESLTAFGKSMEKILEAGLPADVALAALTTVPARILGVDSVVGTLTPGKIANVVVADGPLFAEKTEVRRIFVDGTEYRVEEKARPKGDPNAVVDPRGEWSVVFEFGRGGAERIWTIEGERDALTGTAETRSGTVTFDEITLEGNVLTVVFPARGGLGTFEITVVIEGETFEGAAEMGPRSVTVHGTRVRGPEGGER